MPFFVATPRLNADRPYNVLWMRNYLYFSLRLKENWAQGS